MTMKTKAQKHRKPEAQTIEHEPRQIHGIGHNSANVPARLIAENRENSGQIITVLTKTAVALGSKDGGIAQVEIMERLWKMQREAEDRQAEREYGIAKVALAMQLPTIPKRHKIEFLDKNKVQQSREYADRVDIESVLDPLCRMHGFSKEYSADTDARGWSCQILTVRHVGGHKEVYRSPYMPLDTSGAKNNNQGAGSTAEYGKRYSLIGAFNVIGVDWDDDGNMGKDTGTPQQDKFTARVQGDAASEPEAKTASDKGQPPKLTLLEAAQDLEAKIKACPLAERGALLMKNITVIGDMEKDVNLSAKAAELRKLTEATA